LKVVADHIRALSFAIADGALPGNEGRGYVLRKILRRASRFGYTYLGQEEPFLHGIVPTVARIMDYYPEVGQSIELITRVVKSEEERFLQTLKTGSEMLNGYIADMKKSGNRQLDGIRAFQLHDTYGFPLDLTREICGEEQVLVDETGFNTELEKQRERGRANVVSAFVNFSAINPAEYGKTEFTGYSKLDDNGKILNVVEAGDELLVITDRTPFYAASGGQIGDHGVIRGKGAEFAVHTTDKVEDVFIHRGKWSGTARFGKGDQVELHVDSASRRATMRNHTATHLLHKALQEFLGGHVKQAGSAVDPDRLRFDFTHFQSIDQATLGAVEQRVNERVLESLPVSTIETSYNEAVKLGAMALFGEKYGDVVRLVRVGDYSKELCGGTHISNSSEIGLFAIISESSIASGVRRIEAVTGAGAYARLQTMREETRELSKVLECDPKGLLQKAEKLVTRLNELEKELEAARRSDAKGQVEKARQSMRALGGAQVIVAKIDGAGAPELQQMTDELVGSRENMLCLLASGGEKATFVLKISKDLVGKGLNAGKLIKDIAKIAGGSGGGRPDMATAGGKDPAKIDEALKVAESLIGTTLGVSA
ncbi:MAG TPA: alanine--tRNA ligase, partial [Candidatus Ozemobacteraceae bacterium]|nr:alanine--tRNA ligase [Candidatus Ozemobacteraceae bacterium]